MPTIQATNGTTTVTGRNASERLTPAPSVAIKAYANPLGNFMDTLRNEADGRSAYACAEADALAQLLTVVGSTIDFGSIRFSRPTGEGGLELWQPCGNCSAWMDKASGWGSSQTYKLTDDIIAKLSPKKSVSFTLNPADFPPLSPNR